MPTIDPSSGASEPPLTAGALLTVDLAAVVDNWRLLARTAGKPSAAVVKADGYGLGAVPVGRALAAAGCRTFFVAHFDEGLLLRAALPDAEIAVLNGAPPGTAKAFIESRLLPVLNDPGQISAWLACADGRPAVLHLDTGMNRLGLAPREFDHLADDPAQRTYPWRLVMSHLACADEPEHPMNAAQTSRFASALQRLPPLPASLAASSGIFLGPDLAYDLVRPGAALYGIAPVPGRANPMRQTVRLAARILQVRDVDRGMTVGYGAAHSTRAACRVATIAVGYADGYLRSGSGRGSLRLGDHDVPVIGRVSMDLITIDVTAVPSSLARPGAFVDVIGPHRSPDMVAADAGTIGYEILTSLGRRYHRRYIGG